jgi:membrane-associated phospholipid phosphatase
MRRHSTLLVVLAAAAQVGCSQAQAGDYRVQPPDPALLHTAMSQLTGVIVYDIFSPPQASRVYAYSSIAAYEALRHGYPGYRSLAGQVGGLKPVPAPAPDSEYYLPLSAVHAFMTVGKALSFSQSRMDSLRADMDEQIRRKGIPAPVFARSVAYGDQVAQHILAWAKTDHFLESRGLPKFTVTSEPGRWAPTPPAYMDAVEPNWGTLRPFVMDSAGQFRPKPALAFDTAAGSPFFAEVREVYETRRQLTEKQRAIAAFWDCNPYVMHVRGHAMYATKKITPGGHWMGIVGIAAQKSGADFMQSAEAYARTAIALADGFLSAWDEKYRSNVVRPETVINTYLDEQWEPLLQTPPFPEYPSGHSVISTAAAIVLTDQFGPDFDFRDTTERAYGLPARSFSSFEAAAAEAAISRLYGGIHYRAAIEEGVREGRHVGELVVHRVRTRDGSGTPERVVASRLGGPATSRPAAARSSH